MNLLDRLENRRLLASIGIDLTFGDLGAAPVGGNVLVAPATNGKILAVSDNSAVRLNADGSVDPSFHLPAGAFGSGGFSFSDLSAAKNTTRLFLAFLDGDGLPTVRAYRLSDGSVDSTFGTDGTARIAVQPVLPQLGNRVTIGAARTTPDGGLLLTVGQDGNRLYKLTAAGKIDTTFGDNGTILLGNGPINQPLVAVAPNGKILEFSLFGESDDYDNALKRYNADGTLDTSFGTSGAVDQIPAFVQFPFVYGMVATNDAGALLLVGSNADGPPQGAISLVGGDGRTNGFFGNSLDPDGNVQPDQLLVQSDGKVLGTAGATLFRYNSDGTADTSFDNDGVAWIGGAGGEFFSSFGSEQLATDANGDILVGRADSVERFAALTAGAQLSNGRLLINGTGNDDIITIDTIALNTITVDSASDQINVTINGQNSTFAAADVTSIAIEAGDGNDLLTNNTNLPSTIFGGQGDDTITGGDSNDSLLGQAGNDSISGRDGKDTILGESGRDSLSGNAGKDSIFGGSGSDRVAGNGGRDRLYGGGGNDRIFGGASGDWLYSQGGSDQLFGGGGNDRLYVDYINYSQDVTFFSTLHGGAGNDTLISTNNSVDELFGDAGHDTASTDAVADPTLGVTDVLTSIEGRP